MDDAPAHADVASTSTSAAAAAATATTSAPPPPPAASLPPAINALTPEDHVAFMCRAIALSRAAGLEQRTGGCFGAVVVDSVTKKVLGEGQNRVLETKDPTAHGEITCLREACAKLGSPHLPPGAVLYSSAEPCPMCHAACLWARCRFVFYAAKYEDVMELGRFDDVDFAAEIARRVEEKKREREGEGEEKGRSNEAAREKPLPPPTKPLLEIAPPLLREEALVVWREYAARSDNEHY